MSVCSNAFKVSHPPFSHDCTQVSDGRWLVLPTMYKHTLDIPLGKQDNALLTGKVTLTHRKKKALWSEILILDIEILKEVYGFIPECHKRWYTMTPAAPVANMPPQASLMCACMLSQRPLTSVPVSGPALFLGKYHKNLADWQWCSSWLIWAPYDFFRCLSGYRECIEKVHLDSGMPILLIFCGTSVDLSDPQPQMHIVWSHGRWLPEAYSIIEKKKDSYL